MKFWNGVWTWDFFNNFFLFLERKSEKVLGIMVYKSIEQIIDNTSA